MRAAVSFRIDQASAPDGLVSRLVVSCAAIPNSTARKITGPHP
jgi:hypothetical protein